jgi:hypothetical protein
LVFEYYYSSNMSLQWECNSNFRYI